MYNNKSALKKKWFHRIRNERKLWQKIDLILEKCTDKNVLDVGCVGQAVNFENPEWIHNQVRKVAKSIHGVDIDAQGVKKLNDEGYQVFSLDKFERSEERYDVILILDVIEHVNDPVALLKFYSQYLSQDGIMYVSTPNINRSASFVNILLTNDYPLNMEHVFAMCPKTFMEVVERTGTLEPIHFYWLDYYDWPKNGKFQLWLKLITSKFLFKLRRNFSPSFMYALNKV